GRRPVRAEAGQQHRGAGHGRRHLREHRRLRNAPVLSILLALLAALLFAVGLVVQQRAAMLQQDDEALRVGFLLRLVRQPVWLLGVLASSVGYVAQAGALGSGRLVVVQPLLVT